MTDKKKAAAPKKTKTRVKTGAKILATNTPRDKRIQEFLKKEGVNSYILVEHTEKYDTVSIVAMNAVSALRAAQHISKQTIAHALGGAQ